MESRDPERVHESERIIISKRDEKKRKREGKRVREAEKRKKKERNDRVVLKGLGGALLVFTSRISITVGECNFHRTD